MLTTQPEVLETRLADAIDVVRQRIVANRWLQLWVASSDWVILALLAALAILRSVRMPLIAGLAVVVASAIASAIAAWYMRPSTYGLAQELDRESHLGDRVSTAVYFWSAPDASEVILRQRADALSHLAKVQPRELFPLQMPPKMWRTWALLAGLALLFAFHSVYGPPIPGLREKAMQSHALASAMSPLARAMQFVRGEKKELSDLVASNDQNRAATDRPKATGLPPTADRTGAAKAVTDPQALDLGQEAVPMPAGMASAMQNQAMNGGQAAPGQQAGAQATSNLQASSATDQQGNQTSGGQQSLGEKALQALENLMSSALSSQANSPQTPQSSSQMANTGATAMQAMSGSSQAASMPNQAATQGQTSNSQGAQNPTKPNMGGKHTGAGNGSSPWQLRTDKDPALGANTAKEHVELQVTGFRGAPGKDRADVAPGTAQIPMQDVAPQAVTKVSGAGQDSVPPRYRQYVRDYFQHSGK
jgi:hypothetical protein